MKKLSDRRDPERRKQLILVCALTLVSLIVLGFVGWSSISAWRNSPELAARTMPVVDSETGKAIEDFRAPKGVSFPFVNPATGRATLYPAEACYWTKEGKAKFPPNYVILNERLGKPGVTRCPECGRTVKLFNPMPPDNLMREAWDAFSSTNKR
ncbi:MAG: hypothetical protein U0570_14310 [Phycisphaerales bacterium]